MFKSKVYFLLTLVLLGGCASPQPLPRPLDYPYAFIFRGMFNDVWTATVTVLDIYSITVANRDAGLLQTDWAGFRSNPELYDHPDKDQFLEEVRYRLKIKISKAFIETSGEPAVRVQVIKELQHYKNFYSDWQRIPTDGHEEKLILYRIRQNLRILQRQKRLRKGSKAL